ncbi:MAG: AraC family transcriptional regulator [Bacteroidales bacterium]|nr:AraC family transcriptional regulator [Bacteroidales bacterium]
MANHWETEIGCNLLNTADDKRMPSEFTEGYHVHILVRKGSMYFSDGKNDFVSAEDDLVIWQMSNTIQKVSYSPDFEADFLLASPEFLSAFNPEMAWASKGFVFIRLNPSFHLDEESKRLMDADFDLFRARLAQPDSPFRREIVGRVMQVFLYDLWTVYRHGLSQMKAADNTAQLFLRFLGLVSENASREREVAFYADKLCITAKYLSQISNQITGLPASQWIQFYATFELVSLLDDTTKSLTEIADAMGFSTMSFFSRYVKKVLGKTPTEYRKK